MRRHQDDDGGVTPLLGIVIPTYRYSNYLQTLLDSLESQTDSRWEAIVVDDSGNGSVSERVTVSLEARKLTCVVHDSNHGIPEAWNSGVRELISRNRYGAIAVVHDDDLLHPDYVKFSLHLLEQHPEIAVYHYRSRVVNRHGTSIVSIQDLVKVAFSPHLWGRKYVSRGDSGLAEILNNNFVFCPSMVFNLRHFETVKFEHHWKFVTDLHFVANALLSGKAFLRYPKPMYFYRRHSGNVTARLTKSTERFSEEIALYKYFERRCASVGYLRSARASRRRRSIKQHLAYRMMISTFRLDWVQLRKLRLHWQACTSE